MNEIELLKKVVKRLEKTKEDCRYGLVEYGVNMAINEVNNMIDEIMANGER